MTVNTVKSAQRIASLGRVRLIERVPTGPPRVPENLRKLCVCNSRHFSSQLSSGTLFFGATALQKELSVGKPRENEHAPNGKPPLFTLGEGGSWEHRRSAVFLRVSGGRI